MPYNPSTGVYSLPAIYLAIPGTVIIAAQHNTPLEDLATANNYARPVIAGGTGANNATLAAENLEVVSYGTAQVLTAAESAQARRNVAPPYSIKSATYNAVADDIGVQFQFSATATLTLDAAATLDDNWYIQVFANGGNVTIDPNGSETVNGATTLVVPNGSFGTLSCTGSAFFFTTVPQPIFVLVGTVDLTAAASTAGAFINLSASSYDQYKIEVINAVPATGAVDMYLENSTNNGSSYGATADVNWYRGQQSTNSATPTYTNATADTKTIMANNISNTANLSGFRGDITIFMSSSGRIAVQFTFGGHTGAIEYGGAGSGFFAASSNAFRVRPSSGNWTSGRINLYGIRH